jgi:predicted dehydrogenase
VKAEPFRKLEEVRWGIIGCGDVCEVKSGPGVMNTDGSRVVRVMRRDAAKAADFAERHNVPKHSGDAADVLGDPEVNAVYVATPPGQHERYALAAAEAGKACYVEKPMARTAAECQRMVDAFDAKKLPLFVAYYRRLLPRWAKVKQLLDAGELGTLTDVSYRMTRLFRPQRQTDWRHDPAQSGGGLVMDLGSHLLDLLDHLLGPLEHVAGHSRRHGGNEVEDVTAMTFAAGDALGTATWNFAGSTMEDELTLTGTAGHLTITCFGNEPFTLYRADGGDEIFDLPSPPDVQRFLVHTIIHDLRTGEETCPSTGHSAMRTNTVLDAIRKVGE